MKKAIYNWSIYKIENEMKNGHICEYLSDVLDTDNEDKVIEILKVSGYFLFYKENYKINQKYIKKVDDFIKSSLSEKSKSRIGLLKKEALILINKREKISKTLDNLLVNYKVDTYILINEAVNMLNEIDIKFNAENMQQIVSTKEYVVFSLGAILRALPYLKNQEKNEKFDVDNNLIKEIFNQANLLREVNDIIMAWMYGSVSIISDIEELYIEEVNLNDSINVQRIISAMIYFDVKDNKARLFNDSGETKCEIYEKTLREKVKEYLYTETFEEKYNGIELEKWIKMYTFFASKAYKNENQKYCWITKKEIENGLERVGFETEQVHCILKYIVYSNLSKDLFDSFLIQEANEYIFVPKIFLFIDASSAIISLFGKFSESNIQQKGVGFEHLIASYIKNHNNIKILKNIKGSENIENYELDLVFVLDDIAFFCECKTQLQSQDIKGYYRNICELDNYIYKFERNYNFFTNNKKGIKILKEKLAESGSDWCKIKTYKKIFVGNIFYPFEKIKDIYISDVTSIYRYMNRVPECVYEIDSVSKNVYIYKLFPQFYSEYPSASQLIKFLENKQKEIEIYKKRIKLWNNPSTKKYGISIERFVVDYTVNHIKNLDPNDYEIIRI